MIDGFSPISFELKLTNEQNDNHYHGRVVISKANFCYVTVLDDNKNEIVSDVCTVILPEPPADEESRKILTDWLESVKRSYLLSKTRTISFELYNSSYFPEVIQYVIDSF